MHAFTAKEYFALEAVAEEKHELVDGELYSMVGGPCTGYSSDLRVALGPRTYAYPDYTVICGEAESLPENGDTVTNPALVFEVLSSSTEQYDRGLKLAYYKRLSSIRTIVLVSQSAPWVEVHERQSYGGFRSREYGDSEHDDTGAEALLPAIPAALKLRALYEGIRFSD